MKNHLCIEKVLWMLKVLTERFLEETKIVLLWHPYKTPFWNLIFKSSVISIHMVFTFDNEDFVLQWTLECCIDMFWHLRPEACDELLFNSCTQRITAPEEAANKARYQRVRYDSSQLTRTCWHQQAFLSLYLPLKNMISPRSMVTASRTSLGSHLFGVTGGVGFGRLGSTSVFGPV